MTPRKSRLALSSIAAFLIFVQAAAQAAEPLLKDIRFEKVSQGEEKVFLMLNGPYPPQSIGLKGATPHITCDFRNMLPDKGVPNVVETKGLFITRIKVETQSAPIPQTIVILELAPHLNYTIPQAFLQPDNTYVISIRPGTAPTKKPAPLPSGEVHHK